MLSEIAKSLRDYFLDTDRRTKLTLHEVAELSTSILDEHKRNGNVPDNWRFSWNFGKRMLAKCSYRRRTISISRYFALVATPEQISDSTLHEVAHIIAGPKAGHGPIWKSACIKIGANPVRCASYEECKNIPCRYIGKCPSCGTEFRAHKHLKNMDKRICSKKTCKAAGQYVVWETYKNVIS